MALKKTKNDILNGKIGDISRLPDIWVGPLNLKVTASNDSEFRKGLLYGYLLAIHDEEEDRINKLDNKQDWTGL